LATTHTPPASTHARTVDEYAGVSGTLKPPYPYRIVGRGRSGSVVGAMTVIRTSVPSEER
jgi:hypothetical protein